MCVCVSVCMRMHVYVGVSVCVLTCVVFVLGEGGWDRFLHLVKYGTMKTNLAHTFHILLLCCVHSCS